MDSPAATQAAANAPYAGLTPDVVLDAVDSVGNATDGRLLALNSYENRVYLVYRDGAPPLVAKFYRPGRWSDEAIREEHAFTQELAAAEIPVVAPLAPGGETLHRHAGFRFAVYPKAGGRAPELDRQETLEWMGRFIARLHAVIVIGVGLGPFLVLGVWLYVMIAGIAYATDATARATERGAWPRAISPRTNASRAWRSSASSDRPSATANSCSSRRSRA